MTFAEQAAVLAETQAVIDRVKADGRDILWTLRNGVVLRCRSIPQAYIQSIYEANPDPAPPDVWLETKGRSEPNPDHPDYKIAMRKHADRIGELIISVVLGMATTLEFCPDDIYKPDSDQWVEYVNRTQKFGGAEIPLGNLKDPETRYVSWLMSYAFDNETDRYLSSSIPQWLGGLSQEEVTAAAEAFRGQTLGRTHPAGADASKRANGNLNTRADRRRRP